MVGINVAELPAYPACPRRRGRSAAAPDWPACGSRACQRRQLRRACRPASRGLPPVSIRTDPALSSSLAVSTNETRILFGVVLAVSLDQLRPPDRWEQV